MNIKTSRVEILFFIAVQFSCAARENYGGVTTEYMHSMSSYFVGIKIWAVSMLSLSRLYTTFLMCFVTR